MRPLLLLAAMAATLLPACELRLASDVRVAPDGSGTFELVVALDDELHGLLRDGGVDPLAGIDDLSRTTPGWTVESSEDDAGGLEVSLAADFDDPEGFAALTDGVHAALDAEDGSLWEGLRLVLDGGEVAFRGEAGLLVPRFPGATGTIEFDEDDLAALVEERGDEFVRYELRVTLPGELLTHDADRVTGSSLVWDLPVGERRDVSATSRPEVAATPLLVAAVVLVVATGTAASVVAVRARRNAARRREERVRVGPQDGP